MSSVPWLVLSTALLAACGPKSPPAAGRDAPAATAAPAATCPAPATACASDPDGDCAGTAALFAAGDVDPRVAEVRVTLAPLNYEAPVLNRFAAGGGRGSRTWSAAAFQDLLTAAGGVRAFLGLAADACIQIDPVSGCALCEDRTVHRILVDGTDGRLVATVRAGTLELWVPPFDHHVQAIKPWLDREP
jgi:hypothetical protein